MLELTDVHVRYGNIRALQGVSLRVDTGELVALIGSNGAGKSTTLRTISGLLRPTQGTIRFEGTDITTEATDRIVAMGISHCPEGRHIFGSLTVAENLRLGAVSRSDTPGISADLAMVFDLFPILKERTGQAGGTLSGGEQQMLAIGRALMSRPRLLLLDEPSLGLAPLMVERIFATIAALKAQGLTILLVEQNVHQAFDVADRAYVIETGRITLEGEAAILRTTRRSSSPTSASAVSRCDRLHAAADHQCAERGEPLRADGGRSRDGLRDPAADQLRPRRPDDDLGVHRRVQPRGAGSPWRRPSR